MKFRHFALFLILATGLFSQPPAYGARDFTARAVLDTSSITTGEAVRLNITVEGPALAKEPVMEEIDGLQIDFLGRSSSTSYINGEYLASINYSYEISGLKPGSYTLGPFEMKIKNQKITANSVTLQVNAGVNQRKAAPTIPEDSSPLGDKLFLEMELGKTWLYLGEKTPLKVRLYFSEITINELNYPVIDQPEFVLDPMNKPSQRKVIINDRSYEMVEFSTNLTPVKSGNFSLGPALINIAVLIKRQTRDPFFSSFKKYPIELKSNGLNLNILPLPTTGKPAGFSGGIGRFQIQVTGQPTEVLQGEPVTLKLKVTGNGNLQTIGPPSLASNQGLKVYDPQKKSPGEGETGQIHFEQVVIPTDPQVNKIGPFSLAYFDPYQGKYVKTTTPAIPVKVKPNPNFKAALFSDTTKERESFGKDLVFIKEGPGKILRRQDQLIYQKSFWWLQLIPMLGLIIALFYRSYQRTLYSDSLRSRAIRASNRAAKALAKVKAGITSKPENTLDELHLLMREYLGEKYRLTTAGITGDVVQKIVVYGVKPEALREIREFFDQYDYYRFTGNKISPDEAGKLWERVDSIIKSLDQTDGYGEKRSKNAGEERAI
ncbi:MAG: protein BatD [Firmicutes bacterium]|nr:protein BatD [Bacillota bacterium]